MNVGKKIAIGIGVIIMGAVLFWIFDRYTGSEVFVKKDIDASNRLHLSSNEEARKICDGMSSFSHVDGLTDGAFIPFGGRTYYYRSYCYQELARRTLDESLCAKVKRRWTLLGDGTGTSETVCRRQVELARVSQSQMDVESKNRNEQRQQFLDSDPMKITRTWVETLPDNQWRVNVHVEGRLFGQYRFEVSAHNLNGKYDPIIEDSLLQANTKTFSWIIKKNDIVSKSDMLPKIVPISVILTHIDSGQDTSIGNTSISIE